MESPVLIMSRNIGKKEDRKKEKERNITSVRLDFKV